MGEDREHNGGAGHGLQGPHRGLVIPLRLLVLPENRTVELTCPITVVGRHSDADLRLAYADVSRRHCRLLYEDGRWRVVDLDSLNGVHVNEERLHEAVLREGDVIRLGNVSLVVQASAVADKLKSIAEALPRKK